LRDGKLSSTIDNYPCQRRREEYSLDDAELRARRRAAMAVLAEADAAEIAGFLEIFGPLPAHAEMRPPENGLVMLRGRIGGDGAPFNMGEATVSRAVIRLATGEIGFGYVLGHDRAKARLISLCDALLQNGTYGAILESKVISPIRERIAAARDAVARQVAATKVEFFTLVRGED
jgi:alpha-D-ribose 1-methylphosphonate 5-triphosphate synthase subunit PhnG